MPNRRPASFKNSALLWLLAELLRPCLGETGAGRVPNANRCSTTRAQHALHFAQCNRGFRQMHHAVAAEYGIKTRRRKRQRVGVPLLKMTTWDKAARERDCLC
jgi:hypothetical protein